MSEKILVEFYFDCGRMGSLEGLFVTTKHALDKLIGKEVYFGEVLGKHSDVYGEMKRSHFAVKSNDQEKIAWLLELIGSDTISGYNPFEFTEEALAEYEDIDDTGYEDSCACGSDSFEDHVEAEVDTYDE